jgi:pimeloyl-ACP methyl ester carboxylesterase
VEIRLQAPAHESPTFDRQAVERIAGSSRTFPPLSDQSAGAGRARSRPLHAEDIQRRIPDAELEVFRAASHVTMAEVPDAYRARLNAFFDRVERGVA